MASSAEKRIASAIIVLVLECQFFAVLAQSGKWTWPFTDYPMYGRSRHEGDRILAYPLMFATTEVGQEIKISGDDLGLNKWQYIFWASKLATPDEPAPDAAVVRQSNPLHSWLKLTPFAGWLMGTGEVDKVSPNKAARALAEILFDRYEQKHGKQIVRLRIEDNGVIVTKQGMQEVPRKVLAEVDLVTARD